MVSENILIIGFTVWVSLIGVVGGIFGTLWLFATNENKKLKKLSKHPNYEQYITIKQHTSVQFIEKLLKEIEGITYVESAIEGCLVTYYIEYGENSYNNIDEEYNDSKRYPKLLSFIKWFIEQFTKYTYGDLEGGYLVDISIVWAGYKQAPNIEMNIPLSCLKETTRILRDIIASKADNTCEHISNLGQKETLYG